MFKKKAKEEKQKNDTPIYVSPAKRRAKLIIKIAIPTLLVALFAFVVYSVATSDGRQIVFSDEGVTGVRKLAAIDTTKGMNGIMLSDQGMTVVAENENLRLSYSNKEDLFIVTDLASGESFRSYPAAQDDEEAQLFDKSYETGQILTSPVVVGYTESGMSKGKLHGINQIPNVKTVYYIENGVRLRYELTRLELEFSVEITIEDNELVYRIPIEGVIEREGLENEQQDRRPLLSSLSVLPFFGAHREGDLGYFVSPDGSGAITKFDAPRITSYVEYTKKVYGSDLTFDSTTEPAYGDMVLTIGSYGIIDNSKARDVDGNAKVNTMMTSFIEEGDSNAVLTIAHPGIKGLPFYNIYFQYNYRNYYKMKLTDDGQDYDMIVADMQLGDVEQKISITTSADDDFSYVDTAKEMQSYLLSQWERRYGTTQKGTVGDAPVLNLKMFMGAENASGGLLNDVKVMTDFGDVKDIYNELAEMGASDLRLALLGWQKTGYFWNATSKLKVDKSYGGKDELESINKWASKNDVKLSLDNNTLIVYGNPTNGASFRDSIVKQANTFYLNYFINDTSGVYRKAEFYVMGPKYYDNEVIGDVVDRLDEYGTSSVDLRHLGDMLYSDYNEENPLFRVQSMNLYVDWLKKYGDNFNEVAVYTGNAFTVPFIDTILDIPVEKSSHIIFDEEVPLLQLIYHGLVDYYSAPVNNQDDEEFFMLRSIEYGALMSYEVTEEKTSELRYTYYNGLYRSEFDNLKNEIVDRYNVVNETITPYTTLEIEDHYRVVDGLEVFCTEYSDGTCVYVCYETEGAEIVDANNNNFAHTFEGRGYHVEKGGK